MSEKVYSTRNVATQVITIARTCETVNAKMVTGISDQNVMDDSAKVLLPVARGVVFGSEYRPEGELI